MRGFFARNHFLEGGFTFQWGASFLGGGLPMGEDGGEGGAMALMGGSKKSWDASPHYNKPWSNQPLDIED